jgi:hypothetical protein
MADEKVSYKVVNMRPLPISVLAPSIFEFVLKHDTAY